MSYWGNKLIIILLVMNSLFYAGVIITNQEYTVDSFDGEEQLIPRAMDTTDTAWACVDALGVLPESAKQNAQLPDTNEGINFAETGAEETFVSADKLDIWNVLGVLADSFLNLLRFVVAAFTMHFCIMDALPIPAPLTLVISSAITVVLFATVLYYGSILVGRGWSG